MVSRQVSEVSSTVKDPKPKCHNCGTTIDQITFYYNPRKGFEKSYSDYPITFSPCNHTTAGTNMNINKLEPFKTVGSISSGAKLLNRIGIPIHGKMRKKYNDSDQN